MSDSLDLITHLETILQKPSVRSDRARLETLLHPAFAEVGALGRTWDRAGVIEMMAGEESAIEIQDMQARWVGPTIAQVLWTSVINGQRARRSSLWVETALGWQLIFHQGTPIG